MEKKVIPDVGAFLRPLRGFSNPLLSNAQVKIARSPPEEISLIYHSRHSAHIPPHPQYKFR